MANSCPSNPKGALKGALRVRVRVCACGAITLAPVHLKLRFCRVRASHLVAGGRDCKGQDRLVVELRACQPCSTLGVEHCKGASSVPHEEMLALR